MKTEEITIERCAEYDCVWHWTNHVFKDKAYERRAKMNGCVKYTDPDLKKPVCTGKMNERTAQTLGLI